MKLINKLYAIIIPIVFVLAIYLSKTYLSSDILMCGVIAQITTIVIMLPYFYLNKEKYTKLNMNMLNECAVTFLCIVGGYFLLVSVFRGQVLIYDKSLGILLLITGSVLAPISEEMYFRGILVDVLSKLKGYWGDVLSSLLFGVCHVFVGRGFVEVVLLSVLGMYCIILRKKFNNLTLPVTFHAALNFTGTMLRIN